MRTQAIVLAIAFGLVPVPGTEQSAGAPAVGLKTIRTPLPSSEPAMPIEGISCDREGNVYARLLTPNASRERKAVFHLPIQEITPEGVLAKTFRVADIAAESLGKEIFVSNDGTAYQIAIAAGGHLCGRICEGWQREDGDQTAD
jgi:hypothetical protein